MRDVGIIGYGVYVPRNRLQVSEIAATWGKNPADVEKSLGVAEKSVASFDEDAVTLAYEAATSALQRSGIRPEKIEVCLVGSESHPYAVNPTSTIVAEFLGMGKKYLAADLEFACKAATAGMIGAAGLIAAGKASYGLVIGSDTAQAKPHDVLEYTAASAAAAFILGKDDKKAVAQLLDFASFSSDTPDFWRRDGVRFPSHGGRFTGEPAYFTHVESAARLLLEKTKKKPADFDYCIFHMPNGKFPRVVAKRLGFTMEQLAPSLIIDKIGNPYAACSLVGLSAVLDIAMPDQTIFMVSYGSGAGGDAFMFKTNKNIDKKRNLAPLFSQISEEKHDISYVEYLRYGKKI